MNRKSLFPIVVALGMHAILIGSALADDDSGGRKSSTVLVQTAALTRKTLPVQMTTYGTVQPDTGNTVHVVVSRAGQVARLVVAPGQEVQRGQKLFEFATGAATLLGYQQAASAVKFARCGSCADARAARGEARHERAGRCLREGAVRRAGRPQGAGDGSAPGLQPSGSSRRAMRS